jgi:hypothetical protein
MAPHDVPHADRRDQEMAPSPRDERDLQRILLDASDADLLEQELPVAEEPGARGIDAERTEPVPEDDWGSTSPG